MKKCEWIKRLQAYRFAIWEIQLYLDTHIHDMSALESLSELKKACNELTSEYEDEYGPLEWTSDSVCAHQDAWPWVNSPWPWEYKED